MNEQGKAFLAHKPEHANKTVEGEQLLHSIALNLSFAIWVVTSPIYRALHAIGKHLAMNY